MFREQDINPAAFAYYRRLGKVQRFVDEHYADRITLQQAADVACLEKKYFSTYFHSKTGVRFVDWISWVRVCHAKELIRCEDRPLSLVAEATGFSDLRTFERAFKKCTGMTPSDYKNSVRPS